MQRSPAILLIAIMLAANLTQTSAQTINGRFDGVWRWRNRHSELTILTHQEGQHVSGTITAAAFDGKRVSVAYFDGQVFGDRAEVTWRLDRSRNPANDAGMATLILRKGNLSMTFRYDGDQEIWIPEHATLKPGS